MRKRLPPTAKVFLQKLLTTPAEIVAEIQEAASNPGSGLPQDSTNGAERWLYEPRGRVWFFTEIAKRWGLRADEAREAYLQLSGDAQRALDNAVDAELHGIVAARKAAAMERVRSEHGE